MNVFIVYRQWRTTGWFRRERWGPKMSVAVYAEVDEALEFVDDMNKKYTQETLYSMEGASFLYGHRMLRRELLDLLTEDGKRLLGIEE